MARPAVDVVVPFLGTAGALQDLQARLEDMRLAPGDTLTIVDNRPGHPGAAPPGVLRAPRRQTPGHARNAGAARGSGEWIVFFDADTEPAPDLLERYFDPAPAPGTALLGGGVSDEPVAPDGPAAVRYAQIREAMSQEDTFRFGRWGYPKSANVAVRRAAFEQVGGFNEGIRAAEDADLAFRLRAAGWAVERREGARVVHRSRATVGAFAAQKLVHGAGGAWLERRYPGSFPARRRPGLVLWALRAGAAGLLRAAWRRDRDLALRACLEPLELLAWEFGRSLPNERPLGPRVWLGALRRLVPPRGTPRL